MRKKIAVEAIAYAFILLFAYAGSSKLINQAEFSQQLNQSPFTQGHGAWLSWIISLTELVVAVLLSLTGLRWFGLLMSFFVILAFAFYVGGILFFADYVPCTCSSVFPGLGWRGHLLINLLFLCLSVIGIYLQFQISKPKPQFT